MASSSERLIESAKTLYTSAAWLKSKYYNPGDLTLAQSRVQNDGISVKEVISKLDPEFKDSNKKAVTALYKKYKGYGFRYTFHYNDSWVKRLQRHYQKLNQQELVFTGSNISNWAPVSFWALTGRGENIDFTKTSTLFELNALISRQVFLRHILPIKINDVVGRKAKIKPIGTEFTRRATKWKSHTVSHGGGFFRNAGIKIKFKNIFQDGFVKIETFPGYINQLRAEITFKGQRYFAKYSIGEIIKREGLPFKLLEGETLANKIKLDDPEIFREFYENYKRFNKSVKTLSYNKFIAQVKKKGPKWIFSKYRSLNILAAIIDLNIKTKFLYTIWSYCSKPDQLICPYIKVL